ncbi:MAG: hypothetical protein JNJ90_16640 [Saprospiraceae bacterium]|jgi:hypothetical protein|nr:hypothetical protein [Saprospiraceae bacterium]
MNNTYTYIIHALFLAAGAMQPLSAQNRYYVNPAAAGANTGISWTDAFTDLHDALVTAVAGDEVWVAQGSYRPSAIGDRSARFEMLSGVRLYGGFAATELALSERDWQAYPSVLDGDIGTSGDSTDNSRNLLYLFRPDSFTLVDGLTFRHAVADDPAVAPGTVGNSGAALYIMAHNGEAYPTIRNCAFERNTALRHGGAVYVNGGGTGSVAPVFDNCRLVENRAVLGNGGALYRNGGSWVDRLDIIGCVFDGNVGRFQGGAIYFADSKRSDKFDIRHTTFENNYIFLPLGMGGDLKGGTVFFASPARYPDATVLSMRNVKMKSNKFWEDQLWLDLEDAPIACGLSGIATAGNMALSLDSISSEDNRDFMNCEVLGWIKVDIANSAFVRDTLSSQLTADVPNDDTSRIVNTRYVNCTGSRYSDRGTSLSFVTVLDNLYCENNASLSFGMGSYYNGSSSTIIASNIVAKSNKDPKIVNNEYQWFNSGILLLTGANSTTLTESVVISNSSTFDNSIYVDYGSPFRSIAYHNNAFRLSTEVEHLQRSFLLPHFPPVSVVFDNNILNISDTFNAPAWIKTNNQFSTDPQFVNPEAGDFRLRPCSPAINAGDNAAVVSATDIFGNPRIQYGTVDIGAVEMGELYFADNTPAIQPACPGASNGSIDVSGLEACPPVAYQWDAAPGNNSPQLSGLAPGEYALTATDANGRTVVAVLSVPLGPPPTLSPLPTPVACGDTLGGSVAVSVSGATAPLAFDWGALGSDSLLSGLPPGLYPVTVTDARGCTAVGSVEVDRSGNLGVDITAQPVSCHGSADGSLTVLPANGKAPFTWNWSNPPGAATPTVGPLGPGTYEGTLTDAFGCTIGWVLPLGQPGLLQPSAFVTDASDTGKADGAILLIPTGGTGPYSALWAGGQTGLLLDSLPPGAYFATVTDANGCTAATPPVLVGVTTAAGEPDAPAGWQVLPNPATDATSVVLSGPAPVSLPVRLWAADGRLALERVLPAGADRLHLRVGDLPRGMYFVQVGAAVRKVVLR